MLFTPPTMNSSPQIDLQASQIGSPLASSFFPSQICQRHEIHCYFPYSDKFIDSVYQMIGCIQKQTGGVRVHHLEMTLFLDDPPVVDAENNTENKMTKCKSLEEKVMTDDEEELKDFEDINDKAYIPGREEVFKYRPVMLKKKKKKLLKKRVYSHKDHRKPGSMEYLKRPSSDTSWSCKICGRELSNEFNLERHMLVHSSNRPFSCPSCLCRFKDEITMIRHQYIHLTPDQLRCDVCGMRFKWMCKLKEHRASAHADDTFACDSCSATFSDPRNLKRHQQQIHDDESALQK